MEASGREFHRPNQRAGFADGFGELVFRDGIRNDSPAGLDVAPVVLCDKRSNTIQWVTIPFMFIAGTNFALHYRAVTGGGKTYLSDVEWRVFASVATLAAAACFLALAARSDGDVSTTENLRHAMFNVTAIITTTGFTISDFGAWPSVSQVILLGLMFMGAMGGSTGGGFKVVRAVVMAKLTVGEFRRVVHPQAVIVTRLGRKPVRPDMLLKVVGFFALYVATHGIGTVLLAAMGYDFITSASLAKF